MSTPRGSPLVWAAAILVVISAGLVGWAWTERHRAEGELAEQSRQQVTMETDLKAAAVSVEKLKRAEAEAAARPAAPAAAKPKARPDIDAILNSHPELLATFVKGIRAYTDQSYGALFARLHLSPDQIDRLETLIVNGLENQLDLGSVARAQGLAGNDPVIVKEREQQKADMEAAERALLGPEAYAAYHTATRAETIRGTAEQVAGMTQFSAAPLSGDQTAQLVQVLAQASGDFRNGKDASVGSVDWDAVMTQAPTFLSAAQVATLQGVAQVNRFTSLAKEFDAAQAAAKSDGASAPPP
jgi:hypothetical protein